MMSTNTISDESIRKAADAIRGGGIVAFPTETVYGLGANAFDEKAVARVFEVKKRPFFDPLILHISDKGQLDDLVTGVPPSAQKLIDKFWPGPLTIVLHKKPVVPDIATAGLPGVAVRVPSNEIARRIINKAGVPVAAPSANLFGSVSPTAAEHVREQLGGSVDMIVDGGECTVGIESTIVSFMGNTPVMLRPGGVPVEEIEEVIGKVVIPRDDEFVNQSPGRSERHYATGVPLVLVGDIGGIRDIKDIKDDNGDSGVNAHCRGELCSPAPGINEIGIGLLALSPIPQKSLSQNIVKVEYLSKYGDLREAACSLFAAMRRLDASGVDVIVAVSVPNTGLGMAINDRLRRASQKRINNG